MSASSPKNGQSGWGSRMGIAEGVEQEVGKQMGGGGVAAPNIGAISPYICTVICSIYSTQAMSSAILFIAHTTESRPIDSRYRCCRAPSDSPASLGNEPAQRPFFCANSQCSYSRTIPATYIDCIPTLIAAMVDGCWYPVPTSALLKGIKCPP